MDDEIQAEQPRVQANESTAIRSGLPPFEDDGFHPFKLPAAKSPESQGCFLGAVLSAVVTSLSAVTTAWLIDIPLVFPVVFVFIVLPVGFSLTFVDILSEFVGEKRNRACALLIAVLCGLLAGTIPLLLLDWMLSRIFHAIGRS